MLPLGGGSSAPPGSILTFLFTLAHAVLAPAKPSDAAVNAVYAGSSALLSRVSFIAGSPSEAADLLRAGALTARSAVILSASKASASADGSDNLNDDTDVIVATATLYKLNPELHVVRKGGGGGGGERKAAIAGPGFFVSTRLHFPFPRPIPRLASSCTAPTRPLSRLVAPSLSLLHPTSPAPSLTPPSPLLALLPSGSPAAARSTTRSAPPSSTSSRSARRHARWAPLAMGEWH